MFQGNGAVAESESMRKLLGDDGPEGSSAKITISVIRARALEQTLDAKATRAGRLG